MTDRFLLPSRDGSRDPHCSTTLYLLHFSSSSRAEAENFPLHQQIVRKAHMVARGGAVEQRHLGEAEAALIDAYTINVWIAAA